MKFGIFFGLCFGLFVFISGWIKLLLFFISRGVFGNNTPWLYFIGGIYIGNGISEDMNSSEYWSFFITSMLSSFIVNQIAARYEMKTSGIYGTVSTSASMALAGGLIGMLYRFIF